MSEVYSFRFSRDVMRVTIELSEPSLSSFSHNPPTCVPALWAAAYHHKHPLEARLLIAP